MRSGRSDGKDYETEIWRLCRETLVVYSEDPLVCTKLQRSSHTTWFGTYSKGQEWIAEQYQFTKKQLWRIRKLSGFKGSLTY